MDKRQRGVEDAIQKAMDEGKFDDLPGKGQRMNIGTGDTDDAEWAAQRVMESGGFVPDWIAERKALVDEIEQVRAVLARSWRWRMDALEKGEAYAMVAIHWDRAVVRFHKAVDDINPRIRTYNLKAKLPGMHVPVIDVEREINRLQEAE